MVFLKQFLEKLGLSQKERQILLWVFIASFGLSICGVGTIWFLSVLKQKNTASEIMKKNSRPSITPSTKANTHLQSIDIQAHRYVAGYFTSINQPINAIAHYRRILEAKPKDRDASIALATVGIEGGLFEESIILFENLLQNDNSDSLSCLIQARYALALFHSGKIARSIATLESSLTQHPDCAEAACFRGQVEAAVNPNSPAILEYLNKATHLDSTYVEGWYQLARYTMNKPRASRPDYIKARDYLLKVLASAPLHAKAHSRLGMVYYYLEQPGPAQKSYETALALNPDDYNTCFNLGELHYTIWENTAEALRAFKRTVDLKQDHTRANFRIGLISLRNNMTREAVNYLQRAHKSDPGDIRILLQLAVAYERLGVREKAMQTYRTILSLDTLNEIARHKLLLLAESTQ